jgi:hypothetical protein
MVHSFSLILAGKSRSNFPHARRVSSSELFGGKLFYGQTAILCPSTYIQP